jgi:hypothetical protein
MRIQPIHVIVYIVMSVEQFMRCPTPEDPTQKDPTQKDPIQKDPKLPQQTPVGQVELFFN